MQTLTINGQSYQVDAPESMPLLWAIRDLIGLTGTKFFLKEKLTTSSQIPN